MSHCDVLSGEERDEGVCLSVCRVDVAGEFEVHARVSGSLVSGSEMRIVVVPGEVDLGRVSVQGEFQPVTGSLFTLGLSLFDRFGNPAQVRSVDIKASLATSAQGEDPTAALVRCKGTIAPCDLEFAPTASGCRSLTLTVLGQRVSSLGDLGVDVRQAALDPLRSFVEVTIRQDEQDNSFSANAVLGASSHSRSTPPTSTPARDVTVIGGALDVSRTLLVDPPGCHAIGWEATPWSFSLRAFDSSENIAARGHGGRAQALVSSHEGVVLPVGVSLASRAAHPVLAGLRCGTSPTWRACM